jgi:uncharacterized protein (DUF305 family)
MKKKNVIITAAVIVALGAGGVGAAYLAQRMDPATNEIKNAERNQSDVAFAQMMIEHHQGALDMASLVADRSQRSDIIALAEQISAAQAPEIRTMTAWLNAWGEPLEMTAMPGHGHMDMGGEDLSELESLGGNAFDRAFLTMMIEHHQGAIDMAQVELRDGTFADAKQLARAIEASQQGEIDTMRGLLASL